MWDLRFSRWRRCRCWSKLKMEAVCSSENIASTYKSIRRYGPDDKHRHVRWTKLLPCHGRKFSTSNRTCRTERVEMISQGTKEKITEANKQHRQWFSAQFYLGMGGGVGGGGGGVIKQAQLTHARYAKWRQKPNEPHSFHQCVQRCKLTRLH
jgi:hypothetical protein